MVREFGHALLAGDRSTDDVTSSGIRQCGKDAIEVCGGCH
jgi:hypothetical protein